METMVKLSSFWKQSIQFFKKSLKCWFFLRLLFFVFASLSIAYFMCVSDPSTLTCLTGINNGGGTTAVEIIAQPGIGASLPSVCIGDCDFTHAAGSTPSVTARSPDQVSSADAVLTIEGNKSITGASPVNLNSRVR